MRKTKIFIEADSIASERRSGIGHATLEMIRAIDSLIDKNPQFRLTVIVPFSKREFVKKYNFRNVRIRSLPPQQKYFNYALTRTGLPIPMDLWFGRGTYIFPNYKNWYVPFSKSLTFVHDLAFKKYPETINPKNLVYLEANFNRWLKRTERVLSISKASADDFKHYFPKYAAKASVVHLGVDPAEFYRRSASETASVLAKYKFPKDYIFYVGNIEPRKNISRLLDAYRSYADQVKKPEALLLVGAGGWNDDEIKAKLKTLQDQGYRVYRPSRYVEDTDLPALYSGAKVLVQVAIHEGFGLSALQARACGTSIIASDLPVFKEVLGAGGADYVDPGDIQVITKALLRQHETSSKDDNKISITLTWDNTVNELMKLIGYN